MEIKIGVRHNTREIVVETSEAKEILTEKVTKAIEARPALRDSPAERRGAAHPWGLSQYSSPLSAFLPHASATAARGVHHSLPMVRSGAIRVNIEGLSE